MLTNFLMINWPNFVYLLVDPGFFLSPLKFLWSIAVRSPHRMDATDRHNGQRDKRTNGRPSVRPSVCVSDVVCGVQQPGGWRQHGERSVHFCSMHGRCQSVVHAERTAAQPGQVGGTHHWNHRSATRCHLCCVVGSCCRCRTTGGRREEGSGRCFGPAFDIWEASHDGGSNVPLSCISYPTHTPLTVNGAGIDTGAQPDTDQAGLLQFTASWLTCQHFQTQRVQNNAARIVLQAPRRYHAHPLLLKI